MTLNADKARRVLESAIAGPMKMPLERAAYGAHQIAASNMIRAIKAVSTERGRDPREFALFAFGGNGPLFACGMAAALGMTRVIVPPSPGLFSSFGLLYADVEHHYSRTFRRLLRGSDLVDIDQAWRQLADQALQQLEIEGLTGARTKIRRSAALHYQGQSFELVVPVPDGPIDVKMARHLEEAFGAEHERPTAIAPVRRSRSSWSRSRSSVLACATHRACRTRSPRLRHRPHRCRPAKPISATRTDGWRPPSCAVPISPHRGKAR